MYSAVQYLLLINISNISVAVGKSHGRKVVGIDCNSTSMNKMAREEFEIGICRRRVEI